MTFKRPAKNKLIEYAILFVILIAMLVMIFSFTNTQYSYKMYDTDNLSYVSGEVVEVVESNITYSGANNEYITGVQKLKVEILEGELDGQTVEIDNYITVQHNVVATKGRGVIVCADIPDNAEPYFSIYNYDRSGAVWIVLAIFILLVIIIGEKNGLMSCIGLGFTMCAVLCVLLPSLYNGQNAIVVSLLVVIASAAVSCFCIGGVSKKTLLNILSTSIGCLMAGVIYKIFSFVLSVSGVSINEGESLSIISTATGLNLGGVLFAGILISSLGAVMDVAVSIGASLHEIKQLNPTITQKELFKSGMNIGRDMIGTMTNTLILAFAGGSIATLLLLVSYGVQYNQLISSNFIALEIANGLAGSAAVVLTVPISALVCAIGYTRTKKTASTPNEEELSCEN